MLILSAIGLVLLPQVSNACGSHKACKMASSGIKENSPKINHPKKESNTCSKEETKTSESKKQDQHSCNGKCNHGSCSCSTVSFSFNIPSSIDLKLNSIDFKLEKRKIFHYKTQLSPGFYSIWLPPVIS